MSEKTIRLRAFGADLQKFRNHPKLSTSLSDPKAQVAFNALAAAVESDIKEIEARELAAR